MHDGRVKNGPLCTVQGRKPAVLGPRGPWSHALNAYRVIATPKPVEHRDLIAAGVAFKADTLAELAEAMGVADPAVLEQTVAAYNECCANGEDPVDLIAAGVAFKADTLAELAEAMGVADPAVLEQTVAAYNECCANGEDPVFFKKAELLVPLSEEGPFYAARFAPTPFGSCGDLSVDAQMRVRTDMEGGVVPGLYAIGVESVGVMHNDYYWALGQTVGWGHTSGVLAAEEICSGL